MSIPEEKLINLIKELPEKDKEEAVNFMEYLKERRRKMIVDAFKNAPVDEEPLSDAFINELKEAEEDIKNGNVISANDVYRELGLL